MKKTLSLLVLLVTIFSFATGGRALVQTAEDVTKGSPSDAYVFPIQPGSDAWRAFMQHTDMVAATQVPLKTLQSMSTEGLIETVLSYPLRIDMLQDGFEALAVQFNGVPELLGRPDAGAKFLARYKDMDLAMKGEEYASLELVYMETWLAQDEILTTLSPTERTDLLTISLEKGQAKQQYPDIYGILSQQAITYIIAKALQADAPNEVAILKQDTKVAHFVEHGSLLGDDIVTLNTIITTAQEYLKQPLNPYIQLSSDPTLKDFNWTIPTPKGTSVPVIVMTYELSQTEIDNITKSAFGNH